VWKWESGQMYPSLQRLQSLADALQVSLSLLLCGYEARTARPSPLAMLSFGKRLGRLRTECGLKPDELSRKIGVTRMCIWKWESGQCYPRPVQLERLAEALETSVLMLTHGLETHVAAPEIESSWFRRKIDDVKFVESLRQPAKR
jgi:transcriptional regulator with XRE-family HTH domain